MPTSLDTPLASRGDQILRWLLFVGVVAGASSIATLLVGYLLGDTPTIRELLAEGDGFLITVAVTADAFGREVQHKRAHTGRALGCGFILAAALMAFGGVKGQLIVRNARVKEAVSNLKQSFVSANPEECKKLTTSLESPLYDEGHVFQASVVLVSLGLVASFATVAAEKE